MKHIRSESFDGRALCEEETKALKLRKRRQTPGVDEWRRTLHQAADIIEHLGWVQGELRRADTHCLVGAVLAAYYKGQHARPDARCSYDLRSPDIEALLHKVAMHLTNHERELIDQSLTYFPRGPINELMVWNDTIADNSDCVTALLRTAAAA